MDKKPYHHLPDGTFRNPEGSPKRDPNIKWSYKIFNEERKKIKIEYPENHVVSREQALKSLEANKQNDYIGIVHPKIMLLMMLSHYYSNRKSKINNSNQINVGRAVRCPPRTPCWPPEILRPAGNIVTYVGRGHTAPPTPCWPPAILRPAGM